MSSPIQNIGAIPEVTPTPAALTPSGGVGVSKAAGSAAASAGSSAAGAQDAAAVQAAAAATSPAPPAAQSGNADLRLVIEDDKAAGCFVYKIVNRVTGEVVQQTPQEQIVKLRESDGYLAGDVIKAQV